MRCSKCHTESPTGAKFCYVCGTPLSVSGDLPHSSDAVGESGGSAATVESALKRLMPEQYVNRLLASKGHVEGERRVVTMLFSDVKGSTSMAESLDPEEVMEIMNGAFEVLIQPIMRYEGTLARLMGDAVLAFFGAPIAHEDDPGRACHAALEILQEAEGYASRLERERGVKGFNVRVGLNTGLVVVGEVGTDLRVEYTAMGDAVNLAARMEELAEPGTVLLAESTHKMVTHCFETEDLGPMRIRGKSEPVRVYRLLRPKSMQVRSHSGEGLSSALVGRETELMQIRSAIEKLKEGSGGRIAIIGEVGLGKSRLIEEVRRNLAGGVFWAECRALGYTQGMSYWMARSILLTMLGLSSDVPAVDAGPVLHESVERLRNGQALDIYAFLARMLDLPLGEPIEERLKRVDSEALRSRISQAFCEYVRLRSLKEPMVLVWDDLHWADPSSLHILEALLPLSDEVPVTFLLAFRSEPGRVEHFHQRSLRIYGNHYQVIVLAPLARSDSSLLLGNLLKAREISPTVRERLLNKSEGNAFFLEEMLRALLDKASVSGRTGLTVGEDSMIQIPDTLRGAITARIDCLTPEERRTLQTASVIGRVFEKNTLARVLFPGVTGDGLEYSLDELRRREFLLQWTPATELVRSVQPGELIFKHNLTQDVAYDSLLLNQRKALHGRVGEAMETLFPERLDELAPTLALHFEKGGASHKALAYLVTAADQARRVAANQEAIGYYSRALALVHERESDPSVVARIHEGLADVYALTAEYGPALDHYEKALSHVTDSPRSGSIHRRKGQVHEKCGRYPQAIKSFEAALKSMRSCMDEAEAARIYTGLGLVYYRREEFAAAMEVSDLALDLMQRLRDEWGIAEACNNLGIICCKVGDLDKALNYHQRSLAFWERIGESYGLATTHNNIGLVYHHQSNWEKAIQHYHEGLAHSEKVGSRHCQARTYDNLSQVYAILGQHEEAMAYLKKAVALLADIGVEGNAFVPEIWDQTGAW